MIEKKLFGTDGIRGKIAEFITPTLCYKVGKALAILSREQGGGDILIGGDTRLSTDMLKASFVSGVLAHGCSVVDAGIVPTPAISQIVKRGYAFGVMITASHNPPEYNGIKIFDSVGNKLNDEQIEKLEYIIQNLNDYGLQTFDKIGKYTFNPLLKDIYCKAVLNNLDINLCGTKVAIDCSNGACSTVADYVFSALNVQTKIYNTNFNGLNINEKCGALHPQFVQKVVLDEACDIGFAFDGDGDRIVCVLKDGRILNGDSIIYVLAKYLKMLDKLYGNCVVGTVLSNYGLEHSLKKIGIRLLRTAVGDKIVSAEMQARKLALGGEKAGHIIYSEFCKTGDAIYIAGLLMKLQKLCGISIEQMLNDLVIYPSVEYNVEVPREKKSQVLNSPIVQNALDECLQTIQDSGRIVLRPSGTENVVRVVVEGKLPDVNDKLATILRDKIKLAVECLK